jgi:hypothetical protein
MVNYLVWFYLIKYNEKSIHFCIQQWRDIKSDQSVNINLDVEEAGLERVPFFCV